MKKVLVILLLLASLMLVAQSLDDYEIQENEFQVMAEGLTERIERDPLLDEIMINEINYNSSVDIGAEADYEFVEIHNPSANGLDIGGLSLAGSIGYTFEEGTMIAGSGFLVIARNPEMIMTTYGIYNVVGPFSGELPDDIGTVILQYIDSQVIIDQVDYEGDWYFVAEYGYSSLELRNPEMDNSEMESWCATYGSGYDENLYQLGGTPGIINLHHYSIYDIQSSYSIYSKKINEMVQCTGIVTAKFFGDYVQRYVIQVPEFLQETYINSGVFVYANDMEYFEEGDIVSVTGIVTENGGGFSDTMIDPWDISLISSGNELPEPVAISVMSANTMEEEYEGVLIIVSGNCSNGNENGLPWFLTDGMRTVTIGGDDDEHYSAPAGTIIEDNDYTVIGIIVKYEIWMRSETDYNEGLNTLPGILAGTVTDIETGVGIGGAEITAQLPEHREVYTTTTNELGEYEMELSMSNYYVNCTAVGYEDPEHVFVIIEEEEETTIVDFALVAGNQPPVLNLPGVFAFNEDEVLVVDMNDYCSDPEGDVMITGIDGNDIIEVQANGMELTFSAPLNWNGEETVTLWVSDQQDRSVVSEAMIIDVYAINDAPWLELPAEITVNITEDELPLIYDISSYCGDIDGDDLIADVIFDMGIEVWAMGLELSIMPDEGFTGTAQLWVTVYDEELQATDQVSVIVTGQANPGQIVFDIAGLESGPIYFGQDWMFDNDGTPFIEAQNMDSNYAYQEFNWNADGHGDGSCDSGGSGIQTTSSFESENLPFVEPTDNLHIYINGYTMTLFEHINTENPGQNWDTYGEAGDHRQYTGGFGRIFHDGDIVLTVTDVLYDVTTYYPVPIGNGGESGYGTVMGEGFIEAATSDQMWIDYFDPDGTGKVYFSCDSMSPVLQDCYGTYDVNDLVIYGASEANHAPELDMFPDMVLLEDNSAILDIAEYAYDEDGDDLTVTVTGNLMISADVDGMAVTFTPVLNWSGSETLTISVSDGITFASQEFDISVTPVNDVPWIDLPDELTINTALDPIPYAFDISGLYGDVDDEELEITVGGYISLTVEVDGDILLITPEDGGIDFDVLMVTVTDPLNLSSYDTINITLNDEGGIPELVFDITGLQAGPVDFGMYWMFDMDATPFIEAQNVYSNYAYLAFDWNVDGHGNGTCDSGGSGVITDEICVSESVPFASDPSELGLFIDDFELTFYEHINTENPGQPWDTMGEAGDQRQYTGGIGTITHNGDVVLSVTDIFYNVTTYYPTPVGNGGASGYGTVEGEGYIDVANSDQQWVDFYDQDGSGLIYFSCGSMSPVLQMCYGTYDVDDLVIYGTEAQNHPPVFYLPNQLTFEEDGVLQIDVMDYAFDPDGDQLTVSVQGNDMIIVSITSTLVTFSAPADWNGSEFITVTVDDGHRRAVTSSQTEVIVIPVNDAPWIDLPLEISIDSEIDPIPYAFDVSPYFGDIDSDDLVLTATGSTYLTVSIYENMLYIDVPQMQSTVGIVTLTVYDEAYLSATDIMTVNVTATPVTGIHGTVTDQYNYFPISDVEIMLTEVPSSRMTRDEMMNRPVYTTFTDGNGYYEIVLAAGIYDVSATHPDYQAVYSPNTQIAQGVDMDYSFTMELGINGYVTSGLYSTGCQYGDGFESVSIGSMQNLFSSCSNDDIGYGDFTDMSETVYAGNTVNVDLLTGYDSNYAMIWVDFNQDYFFTEEELIMESILMQNGDIVSTQAIIPEWALPGEYRMRVRAVYNVASFTASGSYSHGEVEDYTLIVSDVNPPELTIDLPDDGFIFDEDGQFEIDLADYITGSNYTVTFAGNYNVAVILTGTVVQFVPNINWFGTETITFTISDETSRITVSDDIIVTVSGINDAPYIELPTQISFYTYGPRVRDLADYFGDVDGDDLTISVTDNDSIEVVIVGSIIHLLSDDGWTGTDTWTITVSDGVSRATAFDIVNIQVGDVMILNFDSVFPTELYESGCIDWEEDGAYLSVIPVAADGWECTDEVEPSWGYYPGEMAMYPGRMYVDLSYFDLHWFQVDVTLTDYCDIGCTEVAGTMGHNVFMTNANTVSGEETHVTIVNGMGLDLDGFYINTYEGIVHEIHVYFAEQNPTYIGGHITDESTELPLGAVIVTVSDVDNAAMTYTTGTGPDGNYYVEVEPATYDLMFEREGYDTQYYYGVTLAEGDFVDYSFAMVPETMDITLSKPLNAGWNWISLNLECADNTATGVLASIGNSGDYIKNQSSFANYYPGDGWVGTMSDFELTSLYKLRMNTGAIWEITGIPADPLNYPNSLSTGWNWISYLPQNGTDINMALASIDDAASYIKNAIYFSTYNSGDGWYGSLYEMSPLEGYMLQMTSPATLTYPTMVTASHDEYAIESTQKMNRNENWQINSSDYEHNGSIVAYIDGMEAGDELAVFSGEECRGVGQYMDTRKMFGQAVFAVMAFTNETNGEELSFRYYDQSEDQVIILNESLNFTPDAIIGDFAQPLELTLPQLDDDENLTEVTALGKCIPNPFNPSGAIWFSMSEAADVEIVIYNVRGQKITTLVNGWLESGQHNIEWKGINSSGEPAASGIYFVNMKTSAYQAMNKIILLK